MASGKQTSFQFGEVSDSLRFRSDAVSYAAGLSKLRNMYVRRAGGVSNRAGLEFVKKSEFQLDIPNPGGDPGVKGFTVWDTETKNWKTYEYGLLYNSFKELYEYGFLINGSETLFYSLAANIVGPKAKDITMTPTKSGIFLAPQLELLVSPGDIPPYLAKQNVIIKDDRLDGIFPFSSTLFYGVGVAGTGYDSGQNDLPKIPASYLFTGINFDDVEIFLARLDNKYTLSQNTTGAQTVFLLPFPATVSQIQVKINGSSVPNQYFDGQNTITNWSVINQAVVFTTAPAGQLEIKITQEVYLPNAEIRNDLSVIFPIASPEFKRINIYRAASKDTTTSPYYKLVGQIPVTPGGTVFNFSDYGAEDIGRTPPLDSSFFTNNAFLSGANVFAHYQQRIIAAIEPNTTPTIKSGDLIASKLGAPLELSAPLIYTSTGAFQFSIPVTDGSPVVAMLPMERLIVFTERGVYSIRGGEQGALTPTSINPLLISEDGCSKTVQPKMAGFKGYFINNSHTKLMFIVFGDDGNLRVGEASTFSDHTLIEDVVQLEVLSGSEDTVYMLRRDGKLVQVTVTEEGTHGFSVLETSGYIESIFRGKAKKSYVKNYSSLTEVDRYYDVLMCYVIRNGVRTLERINPREDKNREGEMFADCLTQFGVRLSDGGSDGYVRTSQSFFGNYYNDYKVNIKSATDYNAGTIVEFHWNLEDAPVLFDGKRIHFFYDLNGVTRTIRAVITDSPSEPTGDPDFPVKTFGYFESDLPESLQDVNSKTISAVEKNRRMTRWLPALKFVDLQNVFILANGQDNYPVSVYADGEVLSSPLNPNMPTITATLRMADELARVEFPDYVCWGYVGDPYACEFETLDLETGGERTVTDSKKLINAVGLGLMETRGGFAGIPEQTLQNMTPIVTREDESFNTQTKNFNGHIVVHIPTEWNEPGRATIKHVDPSPISILSVYPKGLAGD